MINIKTARNIAIISTALIFPISFSWIGLLVSAKSTHVAHWLVILMFTALGLILGGISAYLFYQDTKQDLNYLQSHEN